MAEVATFSPPIGAWTAVFASRARSDRDRESGKADLPVARKYTIVIVTHNMPSQRQTEDYVIGRFG